MTKYLKLKENTVKCNYLKIELYYDLGGMNYFTGKNEPRGYYLSATPVERYEQDGYISEGYTAFSGIKFLVHTVTKKSQKAEKIAEEKSKLLESRLINYILNANNLELQED